MGFLNPYNLLYLLSAGFLVLIYLRMRPRTTLEVSSFLLFEECAAPAANRNQLRTDLLFWLELLALTALSLAMAGLFIRANAGGNQVRNHALVFNLGASMGAREGSKTRLELAQREALHMISLAPADRFTVLTYAIGSAIAGAPGSDGDAARTIVAGLKPQAVGVRPAALRAALIHANGLGTIDLFSDSLPDGVVSASIARRLHFHQVGATSDNVAIVELEPGEARSSPGRCVVRNFSARSQVATLVINLDGRELAKFTLPVPPHGQVVQVFGPLSAGGLLEARLMAGDALEADNVHYAYAESDRHVRVLVVSPDAGARADLARILVGANDSFTVLSVDPSNLRTGANASGFAPIDTDLAVMHDFYDPGIRANSQLLIFPPVGSDFVTSHAPAPSQIRELVGVEPLLHPLMLGQARTLAVPDWMQVLAWGSFPPRPENVPLAAVGQDTRGRMGLLAFDIRGHLLLDPDQIETLILTIDLINTLSRRRELQVVATGDFVSVPADGHAVVTAPDGSSFQIAADHSGNVQFRPLLTGRYEIRSGRGHETVFANYYDASESNLTVRPVTLNLAAGSRDNDVAAAAGPRRIKQIDVVPISIALLAFVAESLILARRAAYGGWRRV